jgi:hypothetical protein
MTQPNPKQRHLADKLGAIMIGFAIFVAFALLTSL